MPTMTPTYQQAIEWASEWMKENHPEVKPLVSISSINWEAELTEWKVRLNLFGCPMFLRYSTDLGVDIFDFIIPSTKQDFFAVLNILDKQEKA